MIAVLAPNFQLAVYTLQRRGDLEEIDQIRMKGTFKSRREFIVATQPEHLLGVRLTDYIVIGEVPRILVECARARMSG